MSKLNFYLRPSGNYCQITSEEAVNLEKMVEYLQNQEKIFVPMEFWEKKDKFDISATDYLLGENQNDITDLLMETVSKTKACENSYKEITEFDQKGYAVISKKDIEPKYESISVFDIDDKEENKKIEVNDITKTKRYYLLQTDTYEKYEKLSGECFNRLIFHDDAFKSINKLGKIKDIREELTRHLRVLNDVAGKLYLYYCGDEKAVLADLNAEWQIICSGKGSKEETEFNKKMQWMEKEYILTCNPHTKLYKKYTDQRIYFCWGRNEIDNHKIIVVRIGDHWK
jgi:hypothetical protein